MEYSNLIRFHRFQRMGSSVITMKSAFSILFLACLCLLPMTYAVADETGFASMHSWRKERGIMCFADHFHSGSGNGQTKRAARRAAIKSWREFTALEYGSDWARFSPR